jgi:hypothetical protein
MEKKLIVYNKRRLERQYLGKNLRAIFNDIFEKNIKAMNIIAKIRGQKLN